MAESRCDKKHILHGKVKGIIQNGGKDLLHPDYDEEGVVDGVIIEVTDGAKPTYELEFTENLLVDGNPAKPSDLPYLREFETTEPIVNKNYYSLSARGLRSGSCTVEKEFDLLFRIDIDSATLNKDNNEFGEITYEFVANETFGFDSSFDEDGIITLGPNYNLYFVRCDDFDDLTSLDENGKNPDIVIQKYYEKYVDDGYPNNYPEIDIPYFKDAFEDGLIHERELNYKEDFKTYENLSSGIYYLIAVNNNTGVRTYSQPIDMSVNMEIIDKGEKLTVINAGVITDEPEEPEEGGEGSGINTVNENSDKEELKPLYSCPKHKYNIKLWAKGINNSSDYEIVAEAETATRYTFENLKIKKGTDMIATVEDVSGLIKYHYFNKE